MDEVLDEVLDQGGGPVLWDGGPAPVQGLGISAFKRYRGEGNSPVGPVSWSKVEHYNCPLIALEGLGVIQSRAILPTVSRPDLLQLLDPWSKRNQPDTPLPDQVLGAGRVRSQLRAYTDQSRRRGKCHHHVTASHWLEDRLSFGAQVAVSEL